MHQLAQHSLAYANQTSGWNAGEDTYVFTSEHHLQSVLQLPSRFFIEAGPGQPTALSIQERFSLAPDYALSITSASAYNNNVAHDFLAAVRRRIGVSEDLMSSLETCVQEAVANALIHGNLALERPVENLEGFIDFWEIAKQRLADDRYARRRITVALWQTQRTITLAVGDEGGGFVLSPYQPYVSALQGRGHYLIRQLSDKALVGEDRCTLFMQFSR